MSIENIQKLDLQSKRNTESKKFGEGHPRAVLSICVVKKLRKAQKLRAKLSNKMLARRFKITPAAVSHVLGNKTWKHVK